MPTRINNRARPQWPHELTTEQRIEKASSIIDNLVGHAQEIITLQESNRILVYSNKLSGQVGRSYGAKAFTASQHSQRLYGIVRLLAMWDKPGEDRESIPTALLLVNSKDVQSVLVDRVRASWPLSDSFGSVMAERARKRLEIVQIAGPRIADSARFAALRRLRDESLAHNLNIPKNPTTSVRPPKYGDEHWLFARTWRVIHCLNLGVRQTDFAWKAAIKSAQRNAEAFWHGVSIKVLR